MKKLSLDELKVKSFTTSQARQRIGASIICPSVPIFCNTQDPILCTEYGC